MYQLNNVTNQDGFNMILASAMTHLSLVQITGFKSIDSKLCMVKDSNKADHTELKAGLQQSRATQAEIQKTLTKVSTQLGMLTESKKGERK